MARTVTLWGLALLASCSAAAAAGAPAGRPQASPAEFTRIVMPSGALIIVVALAFAVGWKVQSKVSLRWFWVGAAIWTVGVGLKFAFAALLNQPVISGLESQLPRLPYLMIASLYVGLLTGIFEIGITLAAALRWPVLARSAGRAVAVGIGAGGFEALLIGLAALASVAVGVSATPAGEQAREALAATAAVTPLTWLIGPVERVLAILCHTSSRALVLMSVAAGKWSRFWYGFLLLTAVDSIAGYLHVSEQIGKIPMWWVEAMIAPFAIASVFVIRWCLSAWPRDEGASPAAADAQL